MGVFAGFVRDYPAAKTADRKMRLIDGLIHEYHFSLKADPDQPTRSVGPNLIDANLTEVMAFLNELTEGGSGSLPDGNHANWLENARRWAEWLEELNDVDVRNVDGEGE